MAQRHLLLPGHGEVASCRRPMDSDRPCPVLLRALRVLVMVCLQQRHRQRRQHVELARPNHSVDPHLGRVVRLRLRPVPPARHPRHLTWALRPRLRTVVPASKLKLPTSKLPSQSLPNVVGVAVQSFPLRSPTTLPRQLTRGARTHRQQRGHQEAKVLADAHNALRAPRRGARLMAEVRPRPGDARATAAVGHPLPRRSPSAEAPEFRRAAAWRERVQRACCRPHRKAMARADCLHLGASERAAGGSRTESAVGE